MRVLSGWARGAEDTAMPSRQVGPMPWVIAIMVAMSVVAAASGLAMRNIAQAARTDLAGGVTVQILEGRPELRARQAAAAAELLRQQPGVSNVHQVPQAEVDQLLAPWLGGDVADGVPVPALIDATLDGTPDAARLATLGRVLHGVAPAARIDAQSAWLGPVFGAIASAQWLAAALIVALAAALAAVVLLATRTALGNHAETITIVHMLGGTDPQVARIFQRLIGIDAALGALAGFAGGLLAIMLLGRRVADLEAGLLAGGMLGWADWLALALVPLFATVLAIVTARLSVLGALRRML
ncbi:MAG: cell division protein [Proteobacteria bacterium]|nr:cell division protein [Pseudomonadota bacterium]